MPELELGPEKGADLPGLPASKRQGQAWPQNQHSGKPRLSARMRMAKPRAPYRPHAASVRPGDLIRAHTRISQKLLPSDPRPSGGTARVPGRGLAEDLGGFPSLRTSWPPALLGGQSRSQHLARPPGKVAKERELQGLLRCGVSCPGRGLCSSTFRDSRRAAGWRGSCGNLAGGGGRRGGYIEGETPGTLPAFLGSAKRVSREAEKKEEEALLGRGGAVRGPSATPSQGDEEFTSHT